MNRRTLIASGAAAAALGVVGAGLVLSGGGGGPGRSGVAGGLMRAPRPSPATARGDVGGEKIEFLRNPDVVRILAETQALTVEPRRAGSIEMARSPSAGADFLWPAHDMSADILRSAGRRIVAEENAFASPLVVLTWTEVADALVRAGIAERQGETHVLTGMGRLAEMSADGRPWSEIGLGRLFGSVGVVSTHPNHSNSGLMWACLAAASLNGGRVLAMDDVDRVGPRLRASIERLGRMEQSSGRAFRQFLSQGMGAYPMLAGYESQLVEHWETAPPDERRLLAARVRVLYPAPTVFATHPVLALTPSGARLSEAVRSPDLRRVAWSRHGFRSPGAETGARPDAARATGMPEQVGGAMPLPPFAVVERLLERHVPDA